MAIDVTSACVLTILSLVAEFVGLTLTAFANEEILSKHFMYGRLAAAEEQIWSTYLRRGQIGFSDVSQILEGITPVASFKSEEDDIGDEYTELAVNRLPGNGSVEVSRKSDLHWGDEYFEAR